MLSAREGGQYSPEPPLTSVRIFTLFLIPAFAGLVAADPPQPPLRSLDDLRRVEAQVQGVVEKALPATVSIFSSKVGSYGSGVVVSEAGLVLTAGHVVQGLEKVTVVFPGGEEVTGTVLGSNLARDAAMVRIDEKGPWPFAPIARKNSAIGDLVVSLGHAGGYDAVRSPPVRFGRVRARDRKGFIASDCTLIGGDSGGPLFNLAGEVVGIHSNIAKELSQNQHTGIENFRLEWDLLLEQGNERGVLIVNPMLDPERPVIGVLPSPDREGQRGVVIEEVRGESPAELAGLRAGDVVISINDFRIRNRKALYAAVLDHRAGDEIEIGLLRKGRSLNKTLRLARLEDVSSYDR